ncbi:MAG TPA: class I SAM-dependent methyltransferase [Candidatus Paceibacterota bacterium]|nr:class I SAM-dependent methyltransferase [Candidatus Paceibacterota bacterium]
MAFEAGYARYYDMMYVQKDYKGEAAFYLALVKKFGPQNAKDLLSVGAGTLNHEYYFTKAGYMVDGFDASHEMIKTAKQKIASGNMSGITVTQGDMCTFNARKKYDAVLAMFNVVAYCHGLKDLERFIAMAARHLESRGVLIFDCWDARVMQKDPPRATWSHEKHHGFEFVKLVGSSAVARDNSFTRSVEALVLRGKKIEARFAESHKLYGWDPVDVRTLLRKHGFKLQMFSDMMRIAPHAHMRWPMVVIAVKK